MTITSKNTPKYNEIRGWACHGKGKELVPYSYPSGDLLSTDVEIRISHCGICGSDLHTMDSGWGATDYPCIVGHEIVGTVTAIGQEVKHLAVGDRVGVGAQCRACLQSDCFACSRGRDAHCPKITATYNSKRAVDGAKSYGGYAEAVRVQEEYAFKIPESIPSEYAASLLCAGTTVFSPMIRHNFSTGDSVAIMGIGGLGHLAVKFASALGCEVTAISRSSNKKEEALKMGATHFIDSSDAEQVKAFRNKFKFILISSSADNLNFGMLNSLMDIDGKIILVGLGEKPLSIMPFALVRKDISVAGSIIGSIKDVKYTLEFAAKHDIRPTIEEMPMDQVNEAVKRVRSGKVRYRMILKN
ncbi:putative alcohol dehydrogenase [Entomophthora muscae]|uniref:Alcohol dehydrogenase n=1 Tax=Entomophthora muscae TaxID=34485 RepID=A0ACC2SMD2_9FUNG|nr:putative alcohol dehydrogenase [Entomophthora muscae]